MITKNLQIDFSRLENSRGWIYGQLWFDGEFICDTLEIDHEKLITKGIYKLQVIKKEFTNLLEIAIVNDEKLELTRIVTENTVFQKGIRIRNNNNFITIGNKANFPLLRMSEICMHNVVDIVKMYTYKGYEIEFKVTDYTKKEKTCFKTYSCSDN